jgi:negative regulator of flagellin synthesis FlgM
MAEMLSKQTESGDRLRGGTIRAGLVEAVRREIADGSYETPDKLDIAIDRLLKDIM